MRHAFGETMSRDCSADEPRNERSKSDELAVIERIRDGDTSELGKLYRSLRREAYVAVYRLVRCASSAEDLTQETFLALPRALGSFRGGCSLRTFVLSTAIHLARHQLRSNRRGQRTLEKYATVPPPVSTPSPEQSLIERQVGSAIARALVMLSPDKRRTFFLHAFLEYSASETAQLTDSCEITVRTRVHDAKRLLRKALVKDGIEANATLRPESKHREPHPRPAEHRRGDNRVQADA